MTVGYQAPRCANCGHVSGDHTSVRVNLMSAHSGKGVCLVAGCGCRKWVEPEEAERRAA